MSDIETKIEDLSREVETRESKLAAATAAIAEEQRPLLDSEYWHRVDESTKITELRSELDGLRADQARREVEARQAAADARSAELQAAVADAMAGARGGSRSPLAVTSGYLNAFQHALDTRSATGQVFWGDLEERAALTTTTYGSRREWGANLLGGPRLLFRAAGVPEQGSKAVLAQYPKLTLPAPAAGTAEGAALPEFAASTAGNLTLLRYGKFTDLTEEAMIGAESAALAGAHRAAIARDLDSDLIAKVNTDAGAAVAFTADVKAAIRKSIAVIADNTAGAPGQVVVMAHPDNVSLIEDVVSTGGVTIGESFPLFAGALVYASSAVPTGFMLVANLSVGVRFFEGRQLGTRLFFDVKTSITTAATSIICGFATGIISGYAQKVDVVTP